MRIPRAGPLKLLSWVFKFLLKFQPKFHPWLPKFHPSNRDSENISGIDDTSITFGPVEENSDSASVHHESSIMPYSNPKRKLSDEERQRIFEALLKRSDNGKLRRGSLSDVATIFSVHRHTVERIWNRGVDYLQQKNVVDVSRNYSQRSGRKKVPVELVKMAEIPLRVRTNIRSLSNALEMPKTTVYRLIKAGDIRSHSNALKPDLTLQNKKERLEFCLSWMKQSNNGISRFKDMMNMIHIDEKWFFMSSTSQKYYILPTEQEPHRACKSKRFILKVMFMAAFGRPRFNPSTNEFFDEKIGIFPFTYKEPAKRSSKNRVVGTLESKLIMSVTKDVIRACLIEKILLAIRAKWPQSDTRTTIYIQQDNAKPHIGPMDKAFIEAASLDNFDIRLTFQPPNSHDLNVLDLGYFRAIQSLQYKEAPKTIDELVSAVERSFHQLASESLNDVFLSLQACMNEIIKVGGGNNYKIPHIGKGKLRREGCLPSQLECASNIIADSDMI